MEKKLCPNCFEFAMVPIGGSRLINIKNRWKYGYFCQNCQEKIVCNEEDFLKQEWLNMLRIKYARIELQFRNIGEEI